MTAKLPTVGVVSLGCAKNLVDTEIMLGHLARAGHRIVPDGEARVVLVNTCGFIDKAKEESIEAILEQVERKKRGEIDRVVVAGCMVQKYGLELSKEIPEVDTFVGLDELELAPAAASGLPTLPRFTEKPLATRLYDEAAPRVLSRRKGYAYLKVGEGCDNPCTFCTIPQMRGLQRSRSIESLVAEARSLEAQGVSELVLISQDTTRFGEDLGFKRQGLARLVEALLAGTTFPWIRFLYAYPKTLDDSILDVMARESRFVPYVDIPLQHVSRSVLSAMRRGGDPASYRALIGKLRDRVPGIAIRTTFIVGFPGEGDAEFAELCEFVRGAEFDNLGAFTYSP
ncbi:MAG TPA: 30S ribosomal protein S12 methylthiotransferase RimO, partial [Thermoanaerobaculia bacterium]|nr:30S ribosomal protein S12 methylthiotransferase RimO [Thermoanaerobaculia bacterium]